MAKKLRRAFSLGMKLAGAAKNVAAREAKALVKSGAISRSGAKRLVKSVAKYAFAEKRRVEAFVKQELQRAVNAGMNKTRAMRKKRR